MGMPKAIVVQATWDAEAGVWVAESDDVPGLVAEGATREELDAKLQVLIPELLEANDGIDFGDAEEVPLRVRSEHQSMVRVRPAA